jgi:hypothetical protein
VTRQRLADCRAQKVRAAAVIARLTDLHAQQRCRKDGISVRCLLVTCSVAAYTVTAGSVSKQCEGSAPAVLQRYAAGQHVALYSRTCSCDKADISSLV